MADLKDYRLVFVGPADGETAVGDYAENLIRALRPHFGEVVERRTLAPGKESLADIREHRRAVKSAVAQGRPGRVLVHTELAAGGVGPFWSTAGLRDVPVSATVHDPPQGIWWPARTRFVAQHKYLMHGMHYPLRPLSRVIEGAVNGRRTIFALSQIGRLSIEMTYPKTNTAYVPYLVAERPTIKPAHERPKAVGFFGLVYRGKGFEQIARIRRELPDDIVIRVAGRGTESLPRQDGVEILGAVEGPDEDAFFESVRAIAIPYGKRHFYAETYPASSVAAHALAYQTPIVCTGYGSLAEFNEDTGAVVVPMGTTFPQTLPAGFSPAIQSLLNDDGRMRTLAANADRVRGERSAEQTAAAYAREWSRMLDRRRKRRDG
ncbi:Glycosyltransferase involved in cell wall bisynthesis [Mycolicibacterium rutilum]|uniref:Glycosyltransferase involved in cell wall bisynthesis n=1 Tax=Mycolicibacterium rutilum TaxID=370526 RepID=A0A1H6LQW6_MYCRU|nr:glycosyltransferase [Mycolicibacterium rutilum]SEH91078.1 Glycosyltransferase involved in cell wall bisynthesis [Mycolicibacterium rutilum]